MAYPVYQFASSDEPELIPVEKLLQPRERRMMTPNPSSVAYIDYTVKFLKRHLAVTIDEVWRNFTLPYAINQLTSPSVFFWLHEKSSVADQDFVVKMRNEVYAWLKKSGYILRSSTVQPEGALHNRSNLYLILDSSMAT